MSRNTGKFISRETETFSNGDRAITDTFMLNDGTLVFHIYNVTADGKEHSHQIVDEYGRQIYARAIGGSHPWIELNRMVAIRWLSTLSQDKIVEALNLLHEQQFQFISNLICEYQQTNIETAESSKKLYKK